MPQEAQAQAQAQAGAMVRLPPGWEPDYDGRRWFYTYKSTGHVQYHFPSEGDEFPDFFDASAPAPDLAPEERLESQQQLRRQGSPAGTGGKPRARHGATAQSKPLMTATARPVSSVWDGAGDDWAGDHGVFRPEGLLFLGPGTYTDVSPLNEDEDEAAKRLVVGGIGKRVDSARLVKVVSSAANGKTTPPTMTKSEHSVSPAQTDVTVATSEHTVESPPPVPVQPELTLSATATTGAAPASPPAVHMIDGREIPHELPVVEVQPQPPNVFDPVGIVAEMPTEHTARAHVELYPEPVELGDNRVLAPIETMFPPMALAELPERNSPLKARVPWTDDARGEEMRLTHERPRQDLPEQQQPPTASKQPSEDTQGRFQIARKPARGVPQQSTYKPYSPSHNDFAMPTLSITTRRQSTGSTLQREMSLMMGPTREVSENLDLSTVPRVLSPPRMPPAESRDRTSRYSVAEQGSPGPVAEEVAWDGTADHQKRPSVPSVPKPASSGQTGKSGQGPARPAAPVDQRSVARTSQKPKGQGVLSQIPSILKPARARDVTTQPGQQGLSAHHDIPTPRSADSDGYAQGQGYKQAPSLRHPPSMTPGSGQQPPRAVLRRSTTMPDQIPSQVHTPHQGRSGGQLAPHPHDPRSVERGSRPESVEMHAIGHGPYGLPTPWDGRYEQMQPGDAYGQTSPQARMQRPPQPGQPLVRPPFQHSQDVQPSRPKAGMADAPQQQQQPDSVSQTSPVPRARHASISIPADTSTTRSTSASQSSAPYAPTKFADPPQNNYTYMQNLQMSQARPQTSDHATPGHLLLGRIEEHDESKACPEPNAAPQGTRPSSTASGLQHSSQVHRQTPSQQSQAPIGARTVSEGAGAPLGLGVILSQGTCQQTPCQPVRKQHPEKQHTGYPPQMHPQRHVPSAQPQGQMPPAEFGPSGQPFQQRPARDAPMYANAPPQGLPPGPMPPFEMNGQGKEKTWNKWFKSSKSTNSQRQSVQHQPGQIAGPCNPDQPPPQGRVGIQAFHPPGWQPGQPIRPGLQQGVPPRLGPGPPLGGVCQTRPSSRPGIATSWREGAPLSLDGSTSHEAKRGSPQ